MVIADIHLMNDQYQNTPQMQILIFSYTSNISAQLILGVTQWDISNQNRQSLKGGATVKRCCFCCNFQVQREALFDIPGKKVVLRTLLYFCLGQFL